MRQEHRNERTAGAGITVTTGSRALIQELGTTAWAVLEDVVLDARAEDSRRVAKTSVRVVADHLGLTTGTVARALSRLCSAGLVHREDRRDAGTGRFGESVYVVAPTTALCPRDDSPHSMPPSKEEPHTASPLEEQRRTDRSGTGGEATGRVGRHADLVQLALLDEDEPRPAQRVPPSIPASPGTPQAIPNHQRTPNTEARSTPQSPTHYQAQPTHPNPQNPETQRPTDTCHPAGRPPRPGRRSDPDGDRC